MRKIALLTLSALLIVSSLNLVSCGDGNTYAEIETEYGKMKVKLYNSTPKHRDNFIKLTKEGFYDGLLFHRIVKNFMIQGGDPNSKNATPDQRLGMGEPGYTLDAEIGARHFKGALSAARTGDDVNPERKSSGSQFYVVQGQPLSEAQLNQLEQRFNLNYTPEERQRYMEEGGTPFLDNQYTVFGEVVEGLDVIDKIANVPVRGERPVKDVKMTVKIVK